MDGDLIERIEYALQGNQKQIACFWEFVEVERLQPLRGERMAANMKNYVFGGK